MILTAKETTAATSFSFSSNYQASEESHRGELLYRVIAIGRNDFPETIFMIG